MLFGMLLWLVSGAAGAAQAVKTTEIPLESEFQIDPEPMSTDQVLKLDPDVINPQRQRWALERQVEIRGLETFPVNAGKKFGVRASGLISTTRLHLRGQGPWYRPISEFPCSKEPQAWFATESGAKLEGESAADLWKTELDSERLKLALAMERMQGDSEEEALAKGKKLFHIWLRGATKVWREQVREKARTSEWRSYLDTAASEGLCAAGKSGHGGVPWADMMEPAPQDGPNQLLARAPARRWDGLFSIRVTLVAADKKLDGKFLVDTESEHSLVSPSWLINQGVNPRLIELANAPMEKINWGGEGKLARKVEVEATIVSGARVPLTQYFVREIDLFDAPDNVASCCDGVLGRNFLRNYAVEFKPAAPSEVILWNPAGFHLGPDSVWVELAEVPEHGISSDCSVQSGQVSIPGIFWDTGSDIGMTIHSAWRKAVRAVKGSWDLQCGAETIATHLERDSKMESAAGAGETLGMKKPGATIGMPVLGRGPITIDLPHGRLWMAKSGVRSPILFNQSGLAVKYVDEDGDRVLRVADLSFKPGLPAAELARMGLKKGMRIAEVDGKAAEELDLWNVEQRLAGAFGNTVIIKWKTAKGIKIGALRLK